MSVELDNQTEQSLPHVKPPFAYLIYVFAVGIASVTLVAHWGYIQYNFLYAIAFGGAIQLVFRITKRMWLNSLTASHHEDAVVKNSLARGFVDSLPTFNMFVLLYAAMIIVAAFWYGVGRFFGWLLN